MRQIHLIFKTFMGFFRVLAPIGIVFSLIIRGSLQDAVVVALLISIGMTIWCCAPWIRRKIDEAIGALIDRLLDIYRGS
jgi:hypothetical protein